MWWDHDLTALVFLIDYLCFLFRVPCRAGMCTTPLQVTSSQLIASEIFPVPVVKALLYPGAVVNGLATNMTIPSWNNLMNIYNLTEVKEASPAADLQRLEVCIFRTRNYIYALLWSCPEILSSLMTSSDKNKTPL